MIPPSALLSIKTARVMTMKSQRLSVSGPPHIILLLLLLLLWCSSLSVQTGAGICLWDAQGCCCSRLGGNADGGLGMRFLGR